MYKFSLRILLFFSIYFVVNNIYNSFSGVRENTTFSSKYDYLKKNASKYNCVFLGSSTTHNHVIPSLFDSINRKNNIHSFNLGAGATFNPEVFFLYENFLSEIEEFNIKYVFIELQEFHIISDVNLNSRRSYYHITLTNLFRNIQYALYKTEKKDNNIIYKYFRSYLYNLFVPASINSFVGKRADESNIGKLKDGSVVLTDNLIDEKNHYSYWNVRNEFLKDTSIINTRLSNAQSEFLLKKNRIKDLYFEYLIYLIKESEKKGIKLYFFTSPKKPAYTDVVNWLFFFNKNQDYNMRVIDLADPAKYASFYSFENAFDGGHMNEKGAKLFTSYLSNEFARILKNE